jgi:hypothetical protein
MLGLCGNSGRSPYPHLHLHFQTTPEWGSPSFPFDFSNLIVDEKLLIEGKLAEGTIVHNAEAVNDSTSLFHPYQDYAWAYEFRGKPETWKMRIDSAGNRFLESLPAGTRLAFHCRDGLLRLTELEGPQDTGLAFLGSLIAEVPLVESRNELRCSTVQEIDLPWPAISVLGLTTDRLLSYSIENLAEGLKVAVRPEFRLKLFSKTLMRRHLPEADLILRPYQGVEIRQRGMAVLSPLQTSLERKSNHAPA